MGNASLAIEPGNYSFLRLENEDYFLLPDSGTPNLMPTGIGDNYLKIGQGQNNETIRN